MKYAQVALVACVGGVTLVSATNFLSEGVSSLNAREPMETYELASNRTLSNTTSTTTSTAHHPSHSTHRKKHHNKSTKFGKMDAEGSGGVRHKKTKKRKGSSPSNRNGRHGTHHEDISSSTTTTTSATLIPTPSAPSVDAVSRDVSDELTMRDFEDELDARSLFSKFTAWRTNKNANKAEKYQAKADKAKAKADGYQAAAIGAAPPAAGGVYPRDFDDELLFMRDYDDELAARETEGLLFAREFDDELDVRGLLDALAFWRKGKKGSKAAKDQAKADKANDATTTAAPAPAPAEPSNSTYERDFDEDLSVRYLPWRGKKAKSFQVKADEANENADTDQAAVTGAAPSGTHTRDFDDKSLSMRDYDDELAAREFDDELDMRGVLDKVAEWRAKRKAARVPKGRTRADIINAYRERSFEDEDISMRNFSIDEELALRDLEEQLSVRELEDELAARRFLSKLIGSAAAVAAENPSVDTYRRQLDEESLSMRGFDGELFERDFEDDLFTRGFSDDGIAMRDIDAREINELD